MDPGPISPDKKIRIQKSGSVRIRITDPDPTYENDKNRILRKKPQILPKRSGSDTLAETQDGTATQILPIPNSLQQPPMTFLLSDSPLIYYYLYFLSTSITLLSRIIVLLYQLLPMFHYLVLFKLL